MKIQTKRSLMLMLCAFIWGTAFVAQSAGSGMGAYRIGEGDGGANEDSQSQWCTGSALARQVERLHSLGAGGWALYRYDSLFRSAQPELADAERAALAALTTA